MHKPTAIALTLLLFALWTPPANAVQRKTPITCAWLLNIMGDKVYPPGSMTSKLIEQFIAEQKPRPFQDTDLATELGRYLHKKVFSLPTFAEHPQRILTIMTDFLHADSEPIDLMGAAFLKYLHSKGALSDFARATAKAVVPPTAPTTAKTLVVTERLRQTIVRPEDLRPRFRYQYPTERTKFFKENEPRILREGFYALGTPIEIKGTTYRSAFVAKVEGGFSFRNEFYLQLFPLPLREMDLNSPPLGPTVLTFSLEGSRVSAFGYHKYGLPIHVEGTDANPVSPYPFVGDDNPLFEIQLRRDVFDSANAKEGTLRIADVTVDLSRPKNLVPSTLDKATIFGVLMSNDPHRDRSAETPPKLQLRIARKESHVEAKETPLFGFRFVSDELGMIETAWPAEIISGDWHAGVYRLAESVADTDAGIELLRYLGQTRTLYDSNGVVLATIQADRSTLEISVKRP